MGPSSILCSNSSRFYLSILDDYSKYIWFFPMQSKSNVSSLMIAFLHYVCNVCTKNFISVQSDWGGEFRPLWPIFQSYGIIHRITCPYSHQQNGSVERRHRHIVETSLSSLFHASMPQQYWVKAFHTATFLINRMPTPLLNHNLPMNVC